MGYSVFLYAFTQYKIKSYLFTHILFFTLMARTSHFHLGVSMAHPVKALALGLNHLIRTSLVQKPLLMGFPIKSTLYKFVIVLTVFLIGCFSLCIWISSFFFLYLSLDFTVVNNF